MFVRIEHSKRIKKPKRAIACWAIHGKPNVRGHRADEMKDATGYAASEGPGGPSGQPSFSKRFGSR